MKLIEAMKKLKVIEKKVAKNKESIQSYASLPSNEKPIFETEAKQKVEVKALIQANTDLTTEYLKLKNAIDRTNLDTTVEMGGVKYSITDLLVIKRKTAQLMIGTYNALNDNAANNRMSRGGYATNDGKSVYTVRYFDEVEKNNGLMKWNDLYDNVDSRLEVINATTDVIGFENVKSE